MDTIWPLLDYLPDLPLLTLTSLNLNVDKNRHSCTRFPYIFVHVVLKKTQGKLKLFLCENHNQTKEKWIEYYDCKILKCINFWYKILVLGGLFLLTLKMFGGIKNVNPNVKVIHFFASKENQKLVFCYHNCSNVLWEKIVLVWGKKLRKMFANSRP